MALQIMGDNPPYQIIPADEANSIAGMDDTIVEVRTIRKKKIRDVEKGLDEVLEGGVDCESDEEGLLIVPGTVERLSLGRLKIGWFLNATGNFTKRQLRSKHGYLYRLWQMLFISLLITYLLFAFGFLSITDIRPVIVADGDLPFTKIHDAVWELKWALAFILGVVYHGSGHLERFLTSLRLPTDVSRKGKRHGIIYLVTVGLMVIVIPALLHGMQLYDMDKSHGKIKAVKQIIVCDLLYTVFRIVTVPSFCVVTMVLYLIKVQIDSLGRLLKCMSINLGIPYAEREIREVKRVIRTTDSKLKWYLVCHMVLILVTAFTGVFSCIERMHFKMGNTGNKTSIVKINEGKSSHQFPKQLVVNLVQLRTEMNQLNAMPENLQDGEATQWLEIKRERMARLNQKLLNLTLETIVETQMQSLTRARNITLQIRNSGPSQLMIEFLEEVEPFRVLLETVIALVEIIVLFLLPLMLLAWHERALQRITEEIVDLDTEDQRRFGFLIDCKQTKDDIVELLTKMRGVSIFGMRVSFYKAAFISVLSPFIAMTLHVIFKKYGFY